MSSITRTSTSGEVKNNVEGTGIETATRTQQPHEDLSQR